MPSKSRAAKERRRSTIPPEQSALVDIPANPRLAEHRRLRLSAAGTPDYLDRLAEMLDRGDPEEIEANYSAETDIDEAMSPEELDAAFNIETEQALVGLIASGRAQDLLFCRHCGRPFLRQHDHRLYCEHPCEIAAHRARQQTTAGRAVDAARNKTQREMARLTKHFRKEVLSTTGLAKAGVTYAEKENYSDDVRFRMARSSSCSSTTKA